MFFYLLLLFTLVPLTELGILVWIGTRTSVWFTLGIVVATGLLGAALARWQGWRTAAKIRSELQADRIPASALSDAPLIFLAGVLLITPGILTDILGFGLLVPPIRNYVKRLLVRRFNRHVAMQTDRFRASFRDFGDPFGNPPTGTHSAASKIIDVQIVDESAPDDSDSG